MNYYNEFDPKAASWIRELIAGGHIPDGFVDERSIADIDARDLEGFNQCHFFAGIGGWPLALKLAGWPPDRPVWTGSCPCQPFSVAGKGRGKADPRHLWPQFRRLIRQCRPPVVFGEQVASAAGRVWLSGVCSDLEALGYCTAGADLCAAGVGAPHIRQRLYWVAYGQGQGRERVEPQRTAGKLVGARAGSSGTDGGMGHASSTGTGWNTGAASCPKGGMCCAGNTDGSQCGNISQPSGIDGDRLEHAQGLGWEQRRAESGGRGAECGCGNGRGGMVNAGHLCGRNGTQPEGPELDEASGSGAGMDDTERTGLERLGFAGGAGESDGRGEGIGQLAETGGGHDFWSDYQLVPCRDGKARRIESGSQPLAHGIPRGVVPDGAPSVQEAQATAEERVSRLKGYGNAIVPQVAAHFIQASLEALAEQNRHNI